MTIPTELTVRGMAEIISHEAAVTGPYYDSVGVLTDGIGHTKLAGGHDPAIYPLGTVIPLEDILTAFRLDVRAFEKRVTSALTVHTEPYEYDAFGSFDFNTGGIFKAECVKSHNAGNKAACAAQFMNWVKPVELTSRRQKEAKLYATGEYSSNGTALVCPASVLGKPLYSKGKNVNMIPIIMNLKGANTADSQADSHKTTGTVSTTTAAGAGTATAGFDQLLSQLPNLKYVVIAIAVAGALYAAYSFYQTIRKRGQAVEFTRNAAVALHTILNRT